MTLDRWLNDPPSLPMATAWTLADLGEARGRQELHTRQSPQRLKALREHALVESAVSSNRIEGVEIDARRAGTVVFGTALLKDRDEEEVRGYRAALELIHGQAVAFPITEAGIREVHAVSRARIGDAGEYKRQASDIIERYPDGRTRVRFATLAAAEVPTAVGSLVEAWQRMRDGRTVHPLVALAVWNLDFLCVHPFRDGNGRVSRLLMLAQSYALGYEVGRYISLERLIEQDKRRYYDTLEQSSTGWHEGRNDPWPYVNFVLFVLRGAYEEFERRLGAEPVPRGEKTAIVTRAIDATVQPFRVRDLQRACPGVSVDLIRTVLKSMQAAGRVECLGRGAGAQWRRLPANSVLPN